MIAATPKCAVCAHSQSRHINRLLLTNVPASRIARASHLNIYAVRRHAMLHLPWLPRNRKPPVTFEEKLRELKYETARLKVLAECGEKIDQALAAVREQRAQLELELRLGGALDQPHKQRLARPAGDQEFSVSFSGGRPTTREVTNE